MVLWSPCSNCRGIGPYTGTVPDVITITVDRKAILRDELYNLIDMLLHSAGCSFRQMPRTSIE